MIRRSRQSDRAWIGRISADVYGQLGDYGHIIPSWLDHPGVLAFVDQSETALRGFILLGFYDAPLGGVRDVADLLAIAVDPVHQQRGVGRGLLAYAIDVARAIGNPSGTSEIRLTVADDNWVGRRLYRSTGFHVLDEDHGLYDGGQKAIRMARKLSPAARSL